MAHYQMLLEIYTKTILLVVIMLIMCKESTSQVEMSSRIVGGSATSIATRPYLVYLRKNGEFWCGGALVSPLHVVTAAHCVKGFKAALLGVVGGASTLSEAGVRRDVAKIITPRQYQASTLHMDVAVVKLKSAMTGSNVNTIGLCDSDWKAGDLVEVSGWGLTKESAAQYPNRVRTVQVALVAKAKCQQQYKNQATLTSSMFCATVPGQKDSCSGDSGGPVVYKNQLCGIVSWGVGCARPNYPGVYTNVKTVKSFIQKAMKI